jgi:uncharacterized protein YbjT (DUF2867 family)
MDAMASNINTLVTVFGGSGFLGRSVVRALCKRDYRIRVAVRRPELAGHLQPLGKVGQIHAVQANLRYPASVEAAMRDSHVAINLVGILTESGAQTFEAVQAAGAGAVAKAAAAVGAAMVHVSAIGADENSPSRLTKMQPVYVGDVATAVADAVDGKTKEGVAYELGGPEVLTMREIMEIILATIERRRMLVSLPFGVAEFQSYLLQFAPGPLKLTPDQVALLRADNVVSDTAKAAGLTLEGLGIAPDSLEAIAPQYLWRFRKAGQFAHNGA